MALGIQKFKCVSRLEVHKHGDEDKNDLIDVKVLETQVLGEEPSSGPLEDCLIRSEVAKLIEDKIKTAAEVSTRLIVTTMVEK